MWKADYYPKLNGYKFKSKIILSETGKIKSIRGLKNLNLIKDLDIMLFKKKEDIIFKPKNSHDAIGYLICRNKCVSKLDFGLKKAINELKIKIY